MGWHFPTWEQRVRHEREQQSIMSKLEGMISKHGSLKDRGKFKKADKLSSKMIKLFNKLD